MNYKKLIPLFIAIWTCLPACYYANELSNIWSAPILVTSIVLFVMAVFYAVPKPSGEYTHGGVVSGPLPLPPYLQENMDTLLSNLLLNKERNLRERSTPPNVPDKPTPPPAPPGSI